MTDGRLRRRDLFGLGLGGVIAVAGFDARGQPVASGMEARRDWWRRPFRLVQANLREPDVREDPQRIARAVRAYGGNAIAINVGGIVAFYPTQLAYQYRDPFLEPGRDFVAEMIAAAHAEDLAVVGRFDLSKTMVKAAYDAHPEWFMVDRDGSPRIFAGVYNACPNGGWYQRYAFDMLREALARYPLDGAFFNASNPYLSTDYGGVERGSCRCAACRRRFAEMFGRALPAVDGFADPAWPAYLAFQERTADELTRQTYAVVRAIRPDAAIMGRGNAYCDVLRNETQRRVTRAAPEWPYQAGEEFRQYAAHAPGKPGAATVTSHVDYPWRQALESAPSHMLRFAQSLANGGQLDLYLMGTFDDQDDKRFIPETRALFQWYRANEMHYAGLVPAARVALYHSQPQERWGASHSSGKLSHQAWRGAYRALVDRRIPFWMVDAERIADRTTRLSPAQFDAIILPNVTILGDAEAVALDAYVAAGGLVIATGQTGGYEGWGTARGAMAMKSSPIARYGEPIDAHGWTFDAARARDVALDGPRIPVDGPYFAATTAPGARNILPRAPAQRFGPPEFSYALPDAGIGDQPGILVRESGHGRSVHLPWLPEHQYYRDGLADHAALFAALLTRYAPRAQVRLEGPGAVELTVMRQPASAKLMVHIVNFAGQRDGLYAEPPLLHELRLGISADAKVTALVAGKALEAGPADREGYRWYAVPPVRYFEALSVVV